MAPASKAPESASPTTTGPDGSVDNIAQTIRWHCEPRDEYGLEHLTPPKASAHIQSQPMSTSRRPEPLSDYAQYYLHCQSLGTIALPLAPRRGGLAKRQDREDKFPCFVIHRDAPSGEQAASALEANLTNLEGRLDALLAAFESAQEPNEDGTVAPPGQDAKKPDDTVPHKTSNGGTQSSESESTQAANKV
ncbi:hypothetical protein CSAL01_02337 [Colletotrichum salicis]|uniref:Uncharacterized protein n=1 Tax=Colletotrichum salicis TaxID=1209931 RepID=A0A135UL57_9PEZI|nr:hypothetical protein CSAL01_02337 [Colletotrichum salicis]